MALQPSPKIRMFNDAGSMDIAWVQWFTSLVNEGLTNRPKITTKTITTPTTAVQFVNNINALYKRYQIDVINLDPSSINSSLRLQVSTDGGSNYRSGAADYTWGYDARKVDESASDITSVEDFDYLDSKIQLTPATLSNGTHDFIQGTLKIIDPSTGSKYKYLTWSLQYVDSESELVMVEGYAQIRVIAPITGIKLYPSGGKFTAGDVILYGLK